MPFDLARSYFSRDKSTCLSTWEGICIHSENYLNEDEKKEIVDGEYSSRVNSDSALPRSKHSYDRIFQRFLVMVACVTIMVAILSTTLP